MQNIYIGVDSGCTKTQVIIEDSAGNILGEARGGPASVRFDVPNAWRTILDTIKQAGINLENKNYHYHLGAGITGCEIPENCEAFLNTPHPFTNLVLKQDSYTACLGAHAGKRWRNYYYRYWCSRIRNLR